MNRLFDYDSIIRTFQILIVYGMGTQSQILSDTESISSSNMPFPEISHTTNYKHAINDKQTLSSFTTTERGVGDNVAYASNSLLSNGDSVLSSTSKSTQFKPTIISFGTIPVLHGHTSLAEASPTTRTAPESSTKISLTDKSSTASSILPAPKEGKNQRSII